jgi:Na+/proline symporter
MVYMSNKGIAENEQTGNNSEVFSTAGRSISAGLTAADVVSKWTWAATLLQSSNVAWNFGVSGPFWYASGATIQVLLFAILAIEIKRKCPAIHTVLEVVHARWGTTAHMVFLFFCLLTCLIVTAMLILGGADTINALTGMSVYWANFMIPVPVMIYTAFGGLKGTYYASFTHTAVIYLALLIFLYAFDALS